MELECTKHDFEKIILAKNMNSLGKHGFLWKRCKQCGKKEPNTITFEVDSNGKPLSTNLDRVIKSFPNYPVVWEE